MSNAEVAAGYTRTSTGYLIADTGAFVRAKALGQLIAARLRSRPVKSVLAVGCGTGADAQGLAQFFDCRVDCIDLEDYYHSNGDGRVYFQPMDATDLKFADDSFDVVFSFHALEHIPNYMGAISEIKRVLKPNGVYCIGTPNRNRILGYVGVPAYRFRDKLRSNMRDWKDRALGRFRNECGAHAGYTRKELVTYCGEIGPGEDVALEYYHILYPSYHKTLDRIAALRFDKVVWPAVYAIGHKEPSEKMEA